MKRNEFIATTAATLFASPEFGTASGSVDSASKLADALESAGSAPWLTTPAAPAAPAAPELSELERAVVDAAMVWDVDTDYTKSPDPVEKLESAVRAVRDARGGA